MTDSLSLFEQNRQLSFEVKRRIDQIAAINAVATAVSTTLDLDEVLGSALKVVLDVVGAEASGISLINEQTNELVLRAQLGWVHDFVKQNPMRIPLGAGMSGEVITKNQAVVDNHLEDNHNLAIPSFHEEPFQSIVMAPMHAGGKIIGILSIMAKAKGAFDEEIVQVLQVIADTVGVALDNARLYETAVENEQRLEAVLDSTTDGIIATDRNGRINVINHMAETMLQSKEAELIGMSIKEALIPGRIQEQLLKALDSRGDDSFRSFKVTTETEQTFAITVSPVNLDSQLTHYRVEEGWVIVLQDITHQRAAEIARAEFIQAAAHDMRNPLSITRSALGMLNDLTDSDQSSKEVIDLAMGGIERLQSLIDDLLQLEHIESGRNFNLVDFNLLDVLPEIIKEASPLIRSREHTCELSVPATLPMVKADIGWIKRSIHNYLGNAIKYSPNGSAITVRARNRKGFVHVEVEDNGPGIPMKDQSRLFERFYRVRETQTTVKGSGLGLAIVKSVAEAHDGRVYVKSKPGQGSVFGLTLPATEDED